VNAVGQNFVSRPCNVGWCQRKTLAACIRVPALAKNARAGHPLRRWRQQVKGWATRPGSQDRLRIPESGGASCGMFRLSPNFPSPNFPEFPGNCATVDGRKIDVGPGQALCIPGGAHWRTTNYPGLPCSAWRVASRVLMSDSLGSFSMIGSMAHPNPNGTSRVSEIARHSMTTPGSRSSNRQ